MNEELIRRLVGSLTGCPCHCNFCGGEVDDYRGHEHEDDCPYVEAQLLLDRDWRPPEPTWLQPCDEDDCPVDEPHTLKDHNGMWIYARAVEARRRLAAYEANPDAPHEHVWLDGLDGYGESCAIPGCRTDRVGAGHLYVNGKMVD